MDLYLIRHAHAVDGHGAPDGERPLSAAGRQQARDVGAALARHGVRPALIVSSPLVRAVETAELVAVATGYHEGLDIAATLTPEGSPDRVLAEEIEPRAHLPSLALVGHEPSMGALLSALLERAGLGLQKGAVVRLRYTPGQAASLVWTLSPRRLDPSPTL